jgi:hypothetical protein
MISLIPGFLWHLELKKEEAKETKQVKEDQNLEEKSKP